MVGMLEWDWFGGLCLGTMVGDGWLSGGWWERVGGKGGW